MANSILERTTINKNVKAITQIPGWWSELTASGNSLTDTASAYTYVPLIFRATQLISNAVANVPAKFYKLNKNDNGKDIEVEWLFREGFNNLVWRASASMCLTGAAYWARVQNDYAKPQDVKYRNPYSIRTEYIADEGKINFHQDNTGAVWSNFPDSNMYQMVYFAEFDPANDITNGVGSAEVALTNAQLLRHIDRFAAKFFEGGAMPVTFLGMDISTPKEEVSRVERIMRNMISGVSNAFNVIGIRSGAITTQQITPPIKDLAMPELFEQALSNVSLAFGIPKTMLKDAANFATAKEHRLSFYEETIMPRCNKIADAINTQLLADVGQRMEFDFGSLSIFQEDEKDRASVLQMYVGSGLPLSIALNLSGIELDDEQLALLQEPVEEPKPEDKPEDKQDKEDPMQEDLKRWQRKATKRLKDGKGAVCEFESEYIPESMKGAISGALEAVQSVKDIADIFSNVLVWAEYP